MHTNALENHESSNGEEPVLTPPPPSTPPPPVSGYAVVAGAQQNHVDSVPGSPPTLAVSSRLVNHVSSAATTMPSSIARTSSVTGNGTDQSMQAVNHFPGNWNLEQFSFDCHICFGIALPLVVIGLNNLHHFLGQSEV